MQEDLAADLISSAQRASAKSKQPSTTQKGEGEDDESLDNDQLSEEDVEGNEDSEGEVTNEDMDVELTGRDDSGEIVPVGNTQAAKGKSVEDQIIYARAEDGFAPLWGAASSVTVILDTSSDGGALSFEVDGVALNVKVTGVFAMLKSDELFPALSMFPLTDQVAMEAVKIANDEAAEDVMPEAILGVTKEDDGIGEAGPASNVKDCARYTKLPLEVVKP